MATLTLAIISVSYIRGRRKVVERSHVTFLLRVISRRCTYYCPSWSQVGPMDINFRESWEVRYFAWAPCTKLETLYCYGRKRKCKLGDIIIYATAL